MNSIDASSRVPTDDDVLGEKAVVLATSLIREAYGARSKRELRQGRRINRLLQDPDGLAFMLTLTDEVLRIRDRRRAARRLRDLTRDSAHRGFLGPVDRRLLSVGTTLAGLLPGFVMPLVGARVRKELSGFVISADGKDLSRHIARRKSDGVRVNVNLLGEAVLGDDEARTRLDAVTALLRRRDVEYVSVKISSICAQINQASFDDEVDRIGARLRMLYDTALEFDTPKFVNLDMEEFRDLELTVAVFQRVLSEERYRGLDAGIVVQAYLPDSFQVLQRLVPWARERHEGGGGRIKIRIVKGANLAMEKVVAELAGWPVPAYATKAEVDANYKRMIEYVFDPLNVESVRIGIASHNLFEVAWAMVSAESRGVARMIEIEMLEGMAVSIAHAVAETAGGLLLYTPIAHRSDSESVIAYLVRRFEENTGPENFLRHQFSLEPGSAAWEKEKGKFLASVSARHEETVVTRWSQDRGQTPRVGCEGEYVFANEPDTDFSLAANRAWIARHLGSLESQGIDLVVPCIAGQFVAPDDRRLTTVSGHDPFWPEQVAYRWCQADETLVELAVSVAKRAQPEWRERSSTSRKQLLLDVANELSSQRGPLIGAMTRDAGKVLKEADTEVSEAIDLVRYYATNIERLDELAREGIGFSPLGTVLVVPPWNFPAAIPVGGVAAALAAGNTVILKPAPEAVAVAWVFVNAFWSAGVSKEVLQFVPCADGDVGRRLVTHHDVDGVILTGSWDTARMFLGWRSDLSLHAETSGKNAIVVTATADLDNAIADIVKSAFGHAGQKCSAASLVILEASVYDNLDFRRRLVDATRTLRAGPGSDPGTTMPALIRPPEGALADALTRLDAGEAWLLKPEALGHSTQMFTPGIKMGVVPASTFFDTECFGPVLGLVRARDLREAIELQNSSKYGLTAGIHSLDSEEIRIWRDSVQAGNLYVNRAITGAIVQRQPFGGWKRSVIGPGAKAGGPNYVETLGTMSCTNRWDPRSFEEAVKASVIRDLAPSDPSDLVAEVNVLRYRALRRVLLRVGEDVDDEIVSLVLFAARAVGVDVTVSSSVARDVPTDLVVEDDVALGKRLSNVDTWQGRPDKIRFLGTPVDQLRLDAIDAGIAVDDRVFVAHPRIEARRWFLEQALSITNHRHGNVSSRALRRDATMFN
ncbi:MAG: proline dehydrogenase family protein [Acidimicrobiales bacterium]